MSDRTIGSMETETDIAALQALQTLDELPHHSLNSSGNSIITHEQGSNEGNSESETSPLGSLKKRKKKSDTSPRKRKGNQQVSNVSNNQGQMPFLIVPISVPSSGSSTPTTSGMVFPGTNTLNPYGSILYKPNYPNLGTLPPVEQEQYQQFLQQQLQYLDTLRLLREAHSRGQPNNNSTEDQHGSDTTNSNVPLTAPVLTPQLLNVRFLLQEQPNMRQRKSYRNENRYLLPNPMTVCCRDVAPEENLPTIIEGKVSVQLVSAGGEEIPSAKQNILDCPEGGLTQPLDQGLKARFSLKVLETSEGTMFRLLFSVVYRVEGGIGSCEEKILSTPFQVSANIKKNVKELPSVFEMKPKEGLAATETEVWIKGQGFSDRVVVAFGDKLGKIIETTDNLITVQAPARPDFVTGTTVSVVVSNKYSNETLSAEKLLAFIYL